MRPILVLNPRHDDAFEAAARGLAQNGLETPEALQEALRRTYPQALVRPRELSGEQVVIWYVYRDGHWVNGAVAQEE